MEWTRLSPAARRDTRRPGKLAAGAGPASRKPSETLPNSAKTAPLRVGGAEADLREGRVTAPDGTVTELRPQSAAVLRALAARRGETVSKDTLFDEVWGDIAVTEDSLVQCVGDIRRALGGARDALQTLPKRGYRLAADGPAASRRGLRLAWIAVALLAVLMAGLLIRERSPPAPEGSARAEGPVVAVLPFENLSKPGRWDRLARGLTKEVIADLATNSWIFVLADATTRPHAGATPQAVGKALGASRVVTGTVRAEEDRLRVTAALADAATGRQLWAKQWEGPTGDLLAIQAAASDALVGELAGRYWGALARADRPTASGAGTGSLRAYELFLLGAPHNNEFPITVPMLAEGNLRRAVEIDPRFSRAWVALANIQGLRAASATTRAELDLFAERRRAFLARAVEADPDDPGALVEVAKDAARDGDPEAVARALRRAVERAPNDADILAAAAWAGAEGAPLAPEAMGWAERAVALNPDGPSWYRIALGIAAFATGNDARAAEALASNPSDLPDRLLYLAAAEAMLGHADRARQAADRLRELVPGFNLAFHMDPWPWEPGLWRRLHEGAVRAGLGDEPDG
jgi:TolB-like protein/DNA-binding winged helix-turn-helix (wHTH) protein/Tfp pilus assembly protein PilF